MPPSNTTFATAIDIVSLPFDFTQTDINDAGVNFTVYYRFIAPVGSREIGAWGFSGNIGAGYRPRIEAYLGPAGAPTQPSPLNIINFQNKPIQFPVTAGNEYFLEFQKNVDTAGPEDIRVQVEAHQTQALTRGNILVNDDTNNFPLAVVSHLLDNTIVAFITVFAAGEGGCMLPSGISAWENFANDTIRVYDSSLVELAVLNPGLTGDMRIRSCRGQNKFFLGINRNPVVLMDILPAATFGAINQVMAGVTSIQGIAASNDGAILYYSNLAAATPLKRWDISLNSAMSDLVAGIAGRFIVDILVLSDNTVVANFESNLGEVICRRYDATGVLLNTYATQQNFQPAFTFSRLAYALDDTSFWLMYHPYPPEVAEDGFSRFINIRVSDGAILTTRTSTEYETGGYVQNETATPTARFGNSFSCPFVILPLGAAGNTSGIFVITPERRNDNDVSIPNPVFRTALLP